jgi:polyhydroxyalkanoate synthase
MSQAQDFHKMWEHISASFNGPWPLAPEIVQQTLSHFTRDAWQHYQANSAPWQDFVDHAQRANQTLWDTMADGAKSAPHKAFKAPQWDDLPHYRYIKNYYLAQRELAFAAVERLTKDPEQQGRLTFIMRMLFDALNPHNFPHINPDVVQATVAEQGANWVRGLTNWVEHQGGTPPFMPPLADQAAFTLGETLAATPGDVVYENRLFQLIYYRPTQPQQHAVPLLIVPPWINKFYIFDLSPHNSMVAWLLAQGVAVYMMSWVNPDAAYTDVTFDNYVCDGVVTALTQVAHIHGAAQVNTAGYCVGGVALASALAYLAARGQGGSVVSATLLATPLDFQAMGELTVFTCGPQLKFLEDYLAKTGMIAGPYMMGLFAMMRSQELIWDNVIQYYFLGKDPPRLDFLYWNSDCVNVPGRMHMDYVRMFFQGNAFVNGGLVIRGEACSLGAVAAPVLLVGAQNDHIVPWPSTFAGLSLFPHAQFVLGESGHVAGIINPPARGKYGYYHGAPQPAGDPGVGVCTCGNASGGSIPVGEMADDSVVGVCAGSGGASGGGSIPVGRVADVASTLLRGEGIPRADDPAEVGVCTGSGGVVDAAAWLAAAHRKDQSWWEGWLTWLQPYLGAKGSPVVAAPWMIHEPAPGRYAKAPCPPLT